MNIGVEPNVRGDRPEGPVVATWWRRASAMCLNDTIQSLLPAIYPLLKESFGLTSRRSG